ncbi:MAG: DUF3987 domain-containing protein [Verrucomicrobiales bacterium]|nr:DUF3987 domain-containing protein [Verrucomicrobiales bacterium]
MSNNDVIRKAERDVVANYIHNHTPPEQRISNDCFHDPFAQAAIRAIEHLEAENQLVSMESIGLALNRLESLPADAGKIVSELHNYEAWNLPLQTVKQLEEEIRSAYSKRLLESGLADSLRKLKQGENSEGVLASTQEALARIHQLNSNIDWPEPLPLFQESKIAPYPVDKFPSIIRDAISEVETSTQAPLSLVALSALSYSSLAAQHLANVERDSHLVGPISLYCLAIAESGERKSACDNLFGKAIRKFERKSLIRLEPEIRDARAAIRAWEAQRDGVISAIREYSKKGKDDSDLRERLSQLEKNAPQVPREPRLLMENETPASFRNKLSYMNALAWLSAGQITSEGGILFGGHGMSSDTSLDYLATLNLIWDGGNIRTGRRGDGDQDIDGARLTCGIAVQEEVIRQFIEASMARDSGYLSRFILAWPDSNRGKRMFRPAGDLKGLRAFHDQANRLLSAAPNRDAHGRICPAVLKFSKEAKEAWVEYFNETEIRQAKGGDLHDIPDVASKSADQAARIAGIFHLWSGGTASCEISERIVSSACSVARWHLNEALRFLSSGAQTCAESDALTLERWLIDRLRGDCSTRISQREIQQMGPKAIRNGRKLESAIEFLSEKNRVRSCKAGRRKFIEINPALLPGDIATLL